ncbi:MAG: hypothetical protein ACO2PM_16060 [Pyrobaculum sp.]
MTLPKLRGGFPAVRWVGVAFAVLASFALSAAAERVYVYEVESDFEITEDVPHVPGIPWRFGEQLLVVWVPRDVKPGIILFNNETAPIPLYDRTYFLLVVPADARPSQRADAEAFLKMPDGTHPVMFRKPDAGILYTTAHSIEEALTILKQMGLQPEYRGKAELIAKKDPLDADKESPAKTASAFTQVMTPTTAAATQTSATTVTQTYVVETTPAWAVIGVLVVLLAVVAGLALRRRCTSFF